MRISILRFERLVNSIGGKTLSPHKLLLELFERLVNSIGAKPEVSEYMLLNV